MEITLRGWLQLPPLPDEVLGDEQSGYYLGIVTLNDKIQFMQNSLGATVNYFNFRHLLFNRMDKEVFSSGTIQIEILDNGSPFKNLVGAYSHNINDYDTPNDRNEQYAGTSKSLCIRNALSNEFPAFGSLLNRKELVRTIQGKKNNKTSPAITNFQKTL